MLSPLVSSLRIFLRTLCTTLVFAGVTCPAAQLINLSSRAVAYAGSDAMTAGFVIVGSAPKMLLIRASGPALGAFGVPGALAAPQLELFKDGARIGVNSGWDAANNNPAAITAAAGNVGAFAFAAGSKDAALLVTLAPGGYTAQVSPASGAIAPGVALVEVYDVTPGDGSQLINLSTRAKVGTGSDVLIVGFVLSGGGQSRLLARGVGPTLGAFGVPGALADPQLSIEQAGTVLARNDNWSAGANATLVASIAGNVGAFALPAASKDAAFLADQAGGSYTVQISGRDGGTGVALAELYDASAVSPPRSTATWGADYNLAGFARNAVGAGIVAETDANYRKVTNATEFLAALTSKTTKVIEIQNDLDLGWNELPAAARTGLFRNDSVPLLHPVLKATGVTIIDVQDKTGLTIFSASGATIRHAHFNIKRCTDLIVRNLRFDELWEWDESSKGDYDKQGWDFITIDINSKTVWVDHCDFTKVYDGVLDIKGGSSDVTVSWCKFSADDGAPGSFVRQQIDELEKNPSAYAMYGFLRTNGFTPEDIVAISRSQKKGHLVGALEFDAANANLSVTLHHNLYLNMQDRMPRLRAGNVHGYNLCVDNTEALAAKKIRDTRVAAMSASNAAKLDGSSPTYHFGVTLNGAISTEGGAVLVENSEFNEVASPVRNNQVSATQPEYTGKIRVTNLIFRYSPSNLAYTGGSEDAGSPLAPVPAPALAFSWNGFAALPYAYVASPAATVSARLKSLDGAGAGRLTWPKQNWLRPVVP